MYYTEAATASVVIGRREPNPNIVHIWCSYQFMNTPATLHKSNVCFKNKVVPPYLTISVTNIHSIIINTIRQLTIDRKGYVYFNVRTT